MTSGPISVTNIASHRSDRRFFLALSSAIVVFVFIGFARTFYLHDLFGVPAPQRVFIFHGVLMSGWILLLPAQATLISAQRIYWHKRLGIFGGFYAALIVVVGCITTLTAAAREVHAHSPYVKSQLTVLALELTQMVLFACLVGGAVWLRNRHDWHKRLMLLATLCILPNVIVRLSFLTTIGIFQRNITLLTLWALLVFAIAALDSLRIGRIHPVFGLLGTILIASMYAAYFTGSTQAWIQFASGLVG